MTTTNLTSPSNGRTNSAALEVYTSTTPTTRTSADTVRTGREAGELLQRPVQTVTRREIFHFALADWGDNPLESRLEDARTRNAIDKAFRAYPER